MPNNAGGEAPRQTGQPVDAEGRFAVDPTRNVLDLVRAQQQRHDDLLAASRELWSAQLSGLNGKMNAELDSVRREFTLIESRRQEQKTDTKVAVDAALSAAKDAVKEQAAASEKAILKSETAAIEQSRQNADTFAAQIATVTSALSDVKERVVKIESASQGSNDLRGNQRANIGTIVGVAGTLFALISILITVSVMLVGKS